METKEKEWKATAATASKMAASKKEVAGEAPSPGQGATSSQNQGSTQNQGATGSKGAGITPQEKHGAVGSQPNPQQNQGSQNKGEQDLLQQADRKSTRLNSSH